MKAKAKRGQKVKANRGQKAFSFDEKPKQPAPAQKKPETAAGELKAITKAYSLSEVVAAYSLDEICRTIPEVVIEHLKERVRKMPEKERKEACELMRQAADELLRKSKSKRSKD
jgi:hypothetical protein